MCVCGGGGGGGEGRGGGEGGMGGKVGRSGIKWLMRELEENWEKTGRKRAEIWNAGQNHL